MKNITVSVTDIVLGVLKVMDSTGIGFFIGS